VGSKKGVFYAKIPTLRQQGSLPFLMDLTVDLSNRGPVKLRYNIIMKELE